MADQRLGVDAAQLLLADRERDHRHVRRLQALVAELLVERHVGVAVDGRDHRRLACPAANFLIVGDDGLVVAVAERRVLLHDVLVGDALASAGTRAGSCWSCAGRRSRCRAARSAWRRRRPCSSGTRPRGSPAGWAPRRCRTRSCDELLALVLHRVEEQAVQLLEHRQHRLARHRGPAAEDDRDLVLRDQLRAPSRRTAASSRPGRRPPARACLPSTPPLALISSIVISAMSFSDGLARSPSCPTANAGRRP